MTVMIDDSPNVCLQRCNKTKPGTEWVQALADISRSALCCYSKETCACASIANPPNSAQLQGTPYYSHNLHPGPCSSVGMQRGTDRHTGGRNQYTFRLGYGSHEMSQELSSCWDGRPFRHNRH